MECKCKHECEYWRGKYIELAVAHFVAFGFYLVILVAVVLVAIGVLK